MNFFYWNKSFEIGIPEIDHQHRALVEMINALATVITDGGKVPEAKTLIGQLLDYAAVHFSDEERLMDSLPLPEPEKARHKLAHRGFVEKAQDQFRRSDLAQADVAEQVLEFLTTWLISHILGSDMRIARVLDPKPSDVDEVPHFIEISPVERVLIGALSETERRFRMISDHTPALIWVSDSKGARGFVNKALCEHVGVSEDGAADFDILGMIHPEDREAYGALLAALLAKPGPAETEYRLRRYDGEYSWVLEKILPRMDSRGNFMGLIASGSDISSIKEAEVLLSEMNRELEQQVLARTAQLEQMVLTDHLTGVGNRRMLMSRLEEEIHRAHRYQRPLSAVFVDADHFKSINDRFGHAVGDHALVAIANCLKANLRECDLLGRYGGEEFVLLLVETGIDDALGLVERMCGAISELRVPDYPGQLTVSAGLAQWRPGETCEALLKRADTALYAAKTAGRNCCRVED